MTVYGDARGDGCGNLEVCAKVQGVQNCGGIHVAHAYLCDIGT